MRLIATTIALGLAGGAMLLSSAAQGRGQPAPAAPPSPKPFERLWDQAIVMPGHIELAAGATRIYLTDADEGIEARSTSDGQIAWKAGVPSRLPVVATRDVVFVASGRQLRALHEGTGVDRWSRDLADVAAAMAGHGDGAITAAGTTVEAWSADGARLWGQSSLPAAVGRSLLAVDGDLVYVGLADKTLVGLDVRTGAVRWTEALRGTPRALTARDGHVYFGDEEGAIHAYNRKGGLGWRYNRADAIGAPAVDARMVYVTCWDNTILAFTRGNGHLQWRAQLEDRPARGPLIAGDLLVAPLLTGVLVTFSRQSGALVPAAGPAEAARLTDRLVASVLSPDSTRIYTVVMLRNDSRQLVSFRRPD